MACILLGGATAYFLGQAGFQVELLEREKPLGALTTAASLQAVRAQFAKPVNIAFFEPTP